MTQPPRFRRNQLLRLLQIIVALQSGRRQTARDLAATCEVSRRTIFRDFEAIETAGLEIEYDPVSQGYQLGKALTKPLSLREEEILALLIAATAGNAALPHVHAREALTAVQKLIQTMPTASRTRLERLIQALRSESEPSFRPEEHSEVLQTLCEAACRGVEIEIAIQETSGTTRFSIYHLVSGPTDWSIVGWSSFHNEVQSVSISAIDRVRLTDVPFEMPPRICLDRWLPRRDTSGTSASVPWPSFGASRTEAVSDFGPVGG